MKYIFTIAITILGLSSVFSQSERQGRKAQLDALKVKYFTEELDLSETESEGFWPIFYQFEKEQKEIKKAIRTKSKSLEGTNPTQEKLLSTLLELEKLEASLASNKTKLIENCIPVLGLEKATKLVSLEDKLRKRIADRIKNRMDR